MADDFCFALLRTTTLQVLQSAGFESVQLSTADTMTEILGQYMELLANTVSNYAQLSGRTDGNALDDWLNIEGKDFIPTWSEQADPSRIIGTKKEDIENSFVFEYSDSDSWDDLDALISSPMSEVDSSSPAPSPPTNDLPDYVPNYLPTFPILNKEDEMDSLNDIKELQTATLPSQQQQQPNILPHHLTVKKKKKPITNPFTHITPYEESIIATDKDTPTPMALSVLEISSLSLNGGGPGSPPPPSSTSEQRDLPLKRIMESFEKGKMEQPGNTSSLKKARLSSPVVSQQSLSKIFQQATQDDASAGTRLFGRSTSMLGDIVRNLAPPLALSTLSTPNLMVDVMNIGNNESETNNVPSTPSSSAATSTLITLPTKAGLSNNNHHHNTTIDHSNPSSSSGISLTISTKNITSAPSSPTTKSTATPIKTKALSMNQSLNKEEDDIFSIHSLEKERKESSSRPRSSSTATSSSSYAFSPPLSIPSSSTTGAPISLASLANKSSLSSSTTTNTSSKQSSKKQRKLTINLSNLQKKSEDSVSTTSISSSTTTIPANNNNNNNNKSSRFPKSLTIKSSSSTPTINDHHHQHGKSKTISSSSSTPNINSNNNTVNNGSTTSSSYNHSPSPIASPSSATAPKIRFTLKPPEPIIKAEPISPSPPPPSSSVTSAIPSISAIPTKPINNTISIKKSSSSSSSSIQPQSYESSNSSNSYLYNNNNKNNSKNNNNNVNNNNYNLTTTTTINTLSSSPSLPTEQVEDIIRCICENPTIDYGAFMIACDKCGIWYHGSCVGVSELDHVEEWYCQSCQTLISGDRYI
ncbi:unnamed protein product [Cunninghamella echinulata]